MTLAQGSKLLLCILFLIGGELNAELAHWLLDAPVVHSPARAVIVP